MLKKSQNDNAASEAWHELRDVATDRAKDLGEATRSRLSYAGRRARRRASLAWDVLAGRPIPARKWPTVRAAVVGVLAGALAGWGAAELYRRRRKEVNEVVAHLSNELRGAKAQLDERIAKAKATPGSPMEKVKAAVGGGTSNATPRQPEP